MLTWTRTARAPETWHLGIPRCGRIHAVRAEVQQYPDGTWFWQRWDLGNRHRKRSHRGGDAADRREAMRSAAGDLITCIAAPEGQYA
mgnify:CR=1 FL=1